MKKVYELIPIQMPVFTEQTIELELREPITVLAMGLYNFANECVQKIEQTCYKIEGNMVQLFPGKLDVPALSELILGVTTESGLGYFHFAQRQSKHLWECYADFGIPEGSLLNTYGFLNLGGKLMLISAAKFEVDTHTLRIPYSAVMNQIELSRKGLLFSMDITFDSNRFAPDDSSISPYLFLVDREKQNNLAIDSYKVEKVGEHFTISGTVNLQNITVFGNYCFGVEVNNQQRCYHLDCYKISEALFMDIHPYTNDRFVYQFYDCELFWFDREGVILRIGDESEKKTTLPLFGNYSFSKRLSEKDKKNWLESYNQFKKDWLHRSSYRVFE
ncbi:hypothetical protein IW492_15845 [Enterococcus sp. BWB1-3]|uniref:hypothetical protein n=1 Tax=Enterococcus sp. BWB1-3 TaxID=2787713 RepID=UPI001922BF7C|nr:hypothetical protein [Enterococcus sp. BWB1-3]MBL1230703.1 hypothetical protein [Enterococcus sp. BWB1-3]